MSQIQARRFSGALPSSLPPCLPRRVVASRGRAASSAGRGDDKRDRFLRTKVGLEPRARRSARNFLHRSPLPRSAARPLSISASPSPSPSPSSHKVWQHSSARQLFCRRLSGLRRRQAVCNRCAADVRVRGSGRKSRQGESEKAARRRHGDNFQQVGL